MWLILYMCVCIWFFCKQKTAYDMRISDWSSDVCSSDLIAPGINLSIEALVSATALLPRIVVEKPKMVIGTTTVACMHSGVFWGYVGLIEGIVADRKSVV